MRILKAEITVYFKC